MLNLDFYVREKLAELPQQRRLVKMQDHSARRAVLAGVGRRIRALGERLESIGSEPAQLRAEQERRTLA